MADVLAVTFSGTAPRRFPFVGKILPHHGFDLTADRSPGRIGDMQLREVRLTSRRAIDLLRCASARCCAC
jgi:hypothetical protein